MSLARGVKTKPTVLSQARALPTLCLPGVGRGNAMCGMGMIDIGELGALGNHTGRSISFLLPQVSLVSLANMFR